MSRSSGMSSSGHKKPSYFKNLFSHRSRENETLTSVSAPDEHRVTVPSVPSEAPSEGPSPEQNGSNVHLGSSYHGEQWSTTIKDTAKHPYDRHGISAAADMQRASQSPQLVIEDPISPEATVSLWDRAYSSLKSKDETKMKLMAQYEALLQREMVSQAYKIKMNATSSDGNTKVNRGDSTFDTDLRRARLEALQAQKQADHATKGKIIIRGHIIDIRTYMAGLAKTIDFAKDWVAKAAEASPQASVAWSVVCLGLPLLTRPAQAEKSNIDGLAYVSSRMQYYIALERLLFVDDDGTKTIHMSKSAPAWDELRERLVQLYEHILEFQIRSIIRLNKASWYKDIYQADDWLTMRKNIESLDSDIERDSTSISNNESRVELKRLAEDATNAHQHMIQVMQDINATMIRQEMDRRQREDKEKNDECLQALVLDVYYEDGKVNIPEPVPGTCKWFLSQTSYREWLETPGGCLLISADPGCGKSVLAKEILECDLQRRGVLGIYCYFFFKAQTQNALLMALTAVLHQMLSQRRDVIKHLMPAFETHGKKVAGNYTALSQALESVLRDPDMDRVIFVFDALDECEEAERKRCFVWFKDLIDSSKGHKIIATSRAYSEIIESLALMDGFCHIHVGGDNSIIEISEEVELVTKFRCTELYEKGQINKKVRDRILEFLLSQDRNTYLYVHLIFEELSKSDLRKQTLKEFENWIKTLPTSVDQAYERILSRNTAHPRIRDKVFRVLNAMLAAERPLAVREIECLVKWDHDDPPSKQEDLDLDEDIKEFQSSLRDWCGGLIQIHGANVTFIHQTAREFLLLNEGRNHGKDITSVWNHAFSLVDAHAMLAKICIQYLSLGDFEKRLIETHFWGDEEDHEKGKYDFTDDDFEVVFYERYPFMHYAAKQWETHFFKGRCDEGNDQIVSGALELYVGGSGRLNNWLVLSDVPFYDHIGYLSGSFRRTLPLLIAAAMRSTAVFNLVLEKFDLKSETELVHSALIVALNALQTDNVLLLLKHGADPNTSDASERTVLSLSTRFPLDTVLEYLLKHYTKATGESVDSTDVTHDPHPVIDVNSVDVRGLTALHHAVRDDPKGTKTALLLQHGADIARTTKETYCFTDWAESEMVVLHFAADAGSLEAIRKLPLTKVSINVQTYDGRTALMLAARNGHSDVVELLLSHGADVEIVDCNNTTALNLLVGASVVQTIGHLEAVRVLVKHNATVRTRDCWGLTPLHGAAECGLLEMIEIFLDHGAEIDAQSVDGCTALMSAVKGPVTVITKKTMGKVVKLLLDHKANPRIVNSDGDTAFLLAVKTGSYEAVNALIGFTTDINAKGKHGHTALVTAARWGHLELVELLLRYGADTKTVDVSCKNFLMHALMDSRYDVTELLLKHDNSEA